MQYRPSVASSDPVLEAPALVASLDDLTVMGQPVEQGGGHLRVTKDARPFTEGQVGCDDHRGLLIQPADQMEQKLATRLGKRQIAEFVQHNEVHPREIVRHPTLPACTGLRLEPVDQINHVVEPPAGSSANARSCN